MSRVCIKPSKLIGKVDIPPSKSICHRAIISAGLSKGTSKINNVAISKDIEATINAMKILGTDIILGENCLLITGKEPIRKKIIIDCNESGSTLRFLIPLVSLLCEEIIFQGRGRLVERPLTPYYDLFSSQGIVYENSSGKLPLKIMGSLKPGDYKIRGDISSQFISGLLFALPLLKGSSKILVTTNLESRPYIDLTCDVLKNFSIDIINNEYKEFKIEGNQEYRARDYSIEGDFSQAAFYLAAGVLGSEVACLGLNSKSLQGDRSIIEIIRKMGGIVEEDLSGILAIPTKTKGIRIDAAQIPDIVPILAVLGALSEGTTEIINAGRLRIKESDRLAAICSEINKLGGDIIEKDSGLLIHGVESLKGGNVLSHNDHRIAMALSIAATRCINPVIIDGFECIDKSYPNFIEDYRKLGGKIDEWSMGR